MKLILGLYGEAELISARGTSLWTSDTPEMQELFGEFIDEEQIDEIMDYLEDEGLVEDADAVEIVVELPDEDDDTPIMGFFGEQ